MSALYAIHYQGGAAVGFGAVYIGRGKIVGVDINNVRINGTYVEQGGRMKPNVILTAKNGSQVRILLPRPIAASASRRKA